MRKALVISPHFDDAVLSAGQFMAGRPDCDVITVFAGFPKDMDQQTDYDKKTGFKDARDAVTVRRQEDNEALALLHANAIHWEYPDGQYHEMRDKDLIRIQLLEQFKSDNYDMMIAPIGIGHPDHKFISDIIINLIKDFRGSIYFYEDLPLRVVEPELIPERLTQMPAMHLDFPGNGPIADKVRALWCYRSQIGTGILDPYIMYVPERFWRIK